MAWLPFAAGDGPAEPEGVSRGLSPPDELRLTSEDVKSVIERGVATGTVNDEQIRLYQKWLAEAGPADPDVVEFLERKLIGELPRVLDALGEGKPSAVAGAVEAAAQGRGHGEQVEALTASLEQSADDVEQLAAAASGIDPDAEPFTPKLVSRLESATGRLGATLERLNAALEHLRTKSGRLGKQIASMTSTATGAAGGFVAAGSATAAGLPVELSAPGAIAGTLVARWLYARRRVQDPSLPPALPTPSDGDGGDDG